MPVKFTRTKIIWDEKTKKMKPVTITMEIDIDELAGELARRTNRSKSGKSCIYGKVIVAKQHP